jgi:DNA-binding MarR family transcriptional regulator
LIVNVVDDRMGVPWTTYALAGELLDVMPLLGRTLAHHARTIDEEKATLMQVRALFFLIEHPLTASKLAKKRGVSLQAASTLVQGLVERGWVIRVPDPHDRRQSLLEVTPEGLARAQLAKDQMVSHLAGSLDGLETEELAAARVFLPALKGVLMKHLITDNMPDELPCDMPDE